MTVSAPLQTALQLQLSRGFIWLRRWGACLVWALLWGAGGSALAQTAWTSAASLNHLRNLHTSTLLPSGKVLVTGGSDNNGHLASAELYDPATNGWSSAGSLGNARVNHTATLLPGGQVLVVGGTGPGGKVASAELYDPATNSWSSAGSLGTARALHSATLLPNGKVLIAGGIDSSNTLASAELYDPATNGWSNAGSLGTARSNHAATLLPGGKVLVTGGSGGSYLASAELYDPTTDSWSSAGSLGTARYLHTATLLPGGKVLVAGGYNGARLASAELYDPATNGWSSAGSLGTGRSNHTATLLPSGKVLAAGGSGSSGALASAELYDPANDSWSSTGSLGTARYFHTATLLPGGKVLAAGGSGSSGALASAELYDPATSGWSSAGSLGTARRDFAATLLPSGKVLAAGGYNNGYVASAELYDPAINGWSSAGSLGTARSGPAATLLPSGKVLVTGGLNGAYLASAELYDPANNAWSSAGSLGTARANHTATLLPNGKVLVTGGYNGSILASAELYDPVTDSWSSAGNMGRAHYNHAATLLPGGKVLIVGGSGFATAELYDPASNSWSSAGNLGTARSYLTATLLPGGKVLATGGIGTNGSAVASAELYDPATNGWSSGGSLGNARLNHTATLLTSGRVLITGGRNGNNSPFASAELYDPATNVWSSAGSLGSARYAQTATLLPGGNVLVAGGRDSNGALASAELFTPDQDVPTARRPVLTSASPGALRRGAALTLGGTLLHGDSEASGGSTSSSAQNLPLVRLRRLDNDAGTWLAPATSSSTSYTSQPLPSSLAGGWYAVRAVVNGVASDALLVLVPVARVPDAPTALAATTGDGTAALTWTAPADDGGLAITGYTVFKQTVPGGVSSVACTTTGATGCTAAALSNGQAYSFTVLATNAVGDGALSAPVQGTPQQLTNPSVPLTGVQGGGNASVVIAGAPAGCTVGSMGIDTTVPAGAPSNARFPLGVLRFTATGCNNATLTVSITYPTAIPAAAQLKKYGPQTSGAPDGWFTPSVSSISGDRMTATYQVTDNGEGDSDATPGSIRDPFAPMVRVPLAPTSLAATAGDGAVALTWAAPADDGGVPITSYTVFKQTVPGGVSSMACTTTGALGCTATALSNGQAYSFTVRATNSVGDGALSTAVQATPQQITNPGVPMAGVPGGGNASVVIAGAPAGCTVGSLSINTTAPAGAPSNASFPLGVLRFTAAGCNNATLTVSITYPRAIPAEAQLKKYGPQTSGAPDGWFTPSVSSISGDRLTATYQVTDNGEGDSDATPGSIRDPFAPMVLDSAAGVAAIPTLSPWGLILLSLMSAGMGMLAVRRRA